MGMLGEYMAEDTVTLEHIMKLDNQYFYCKIKSNSSSKLIRKW